MEHKFNAQSDLKMLHMHISSFFFECEDIIGFTILCNSRHPTLWVIKNLGGIYWEDFLVTSSLKK